MDNWKHLFVDGEYIARERLLSGLTAEQAARKPSESAHSIYEELWHANGWQQIVVMRDEKLYEEWERGHVYPEGPPANEEEWRALVAEFLAGLEKALELARSPEMLARETSPGETLADALRSLAVHTAYHMGKIVAVRQFIGAWPPGQP